MNKYAYRVRHKNGWGTGCGPRPTHCHTCGAEIPAPVGDTCAAGYGCGESMPVKRVPGKQPALKAGETLERSPAICYACCAANDRKRMMESGRAALYLTMEPAQTTAGQFDGNYTVQWLGGQRTRAYVSNWPGSLKIPVSGLTRGHHNMARVRYDFYFTFNRETWHGTQYGDNTQIAHCRRVKQ